MFYHIDCKRTMSLFLDCKSSGNHDFVQASEQAFRTKKGNGHLYHGNQLDQNTPMISQLKEQMEQLERKLLEKDIQMQGIEASTRQAVLLQFRAREEEFKEQISRKEMEIEKILNRMSGTQHEVEGLRQLLEKAESDVEASNMNVLELQKESHNLQCQVAASLLWMESIASQLDNELADEELDKLIGNSDPATVNGRGGGIWTLEALVDDMSTELSRRKYLASLIAAKRNPTVEMLLLAAELRDQLKASVLQSGRKNT
ncbi:hypothetical protein KP509_06G083000 [Ceratopteris richardii]|uniref:Uncharacterized protein n=1 Tax=Ceratopteris richardii TaxID=49495 RepID=A0A8T2UIG2_CERRI|nr:hypothetical protein KP509_06G083000 [Ceratopteris richardii]